ncbi:60S ribosomal protein eL29 RPL29 [Rhodotorula paludigena]|uniref:60S ribosomal protein eL29 RPL29 n=1 Tax=Rhodotorula paludigena TaxID=86838 RepID=UPI00317B5159
MAKSKNHTNHNQNKVRLALYRRVAEGGSQEEVWHEEDQKAHRNGIKKPATNKYPSMKGVDPKFRRNARYAAQGTQKALAAARASA